MSELFVEGKECGTHISDLEIAALQEKRKVDLEQPEEKLNKTISFGWPNEGSANPIMEGGEGPVKYNIFKTDKHFELPTFRHDITPPSPTECEDDSAPFVEKCSTYHTDVMSDAVSTYNKIKHSQVEDPHGRELHRFDDGASPVLVIVVFKNSKRRLVSINDYVLPMSHFIQIDEMFFVKNTKTAEANHQLRSSYPINEGHVKAYTEHHSYEFENTTVPLLMMAITYFANKFQA